jgi:UPF0176 protein
MLTVNLSAYKFVSLDELPALRQQLLDHCHALGLKGTILLAPEGINLFLAGDRAATDAFMVSLRQDLRFADIVPKESLSDAPPFGRMRVRLKREIITMRIPAIRPEGGRAPAVQASTLRRWLTQGRDDEGRELVLLDTRNDYEIALGRFADAVDYRLSSFTCFPAAIAADRARYEGRTVVSYCTGGIRCEKAALHMRELGLTHVYQLDGGILNYLEQTDGAHWQGACFVFDQRIAIDQQLLPSRSPPAGEMAASTMDNVQCGERSPGMETRERACGEPSSEQPAGMDHSASTRPAAAAVARA